MKKTYVLTILFFSLLVCCKGIKEIEIVKTIEFNTGFVEVYWRFKGIYYDKDYKQEVIYFSDLGQSAECLFPKKIGKSCIKMFNLQGKLLDTIPLINVVNEFNPRKIAFIYPYSKDTIFCGKHTENKIVVINHKGDIYHTINMDTMLPDSLENLYSINQRNNPYQERNSSKILLHPMLNYRESLLKENKSDFNLMDGYELYYKTVHNSPYFFELKNIFSDKINYDFKYYDFYKKHFSIEDVAMSKNSYFKELNNFIFILANSKNLILKIDPENFELLNEISIKSKHTDIGYSFTFEEKFNDAENKKSLYTGRICELFYNEKTEQYFVIVMHSAKNEEEYDSYNEFDFRPFSVIIYNENFENPKEYSFEAHRYICRNAFMSQEGLWMQRKPEKMTKENYGTQIFDLIKFN